MPPVAGIEGLVFPVLVSISISVFWFEFLILFAGWDGRWSDFFFFLCAWLLTRKRQVESLSMDKFLNTAGSVYTTIEH
jgi:hypothetical protein